jgi:hypothetical protein
MNLPSLELKYTKISEKNDLTTNTNTNTINNLITIGEPKISNVGSTKMVKSNSSQSIARIDTPLNVKQFKETLMTILIGYFKNNVILLNNLVELSDKIVTKISDLTLLISLLLDISIDKINIQVEEITTTNCCGKVCKLLPRYRKINDILIDNRQSFRVSHNSYYIQLQTEYNISLDYVLL